MKNTNTKLLCALMAGAIALAMPAAFAGPIYKAASGTDLAAGASWTNGVAPGSGDVATWVTGSLGGALTMSTGPTWGGIAMTAATADPTIAVPGSGTFTLGSSGIDLSASANNLTINAPITLGASQTWNINSGKTLTVGGLVSDGGNAFGITKSGSGTLILSVSNSFGGGVTLNAGAVVLGNAYALGTNSVTLDGGTLKNNGGYNVSNNIVVGASGGTLTLNSANNISYYGNVTGAGNLTLGGSWGGGASSILMYGTNLMTSGTVTMNPNAAVSRLKTPDASSAVLDWVMNGGSTEVPGNFYFGSFSGSGNFNAWNNNSGQTTTYYIGGNNHDATYSAALSANGTGQQLSIVKVGTGAQTFSGNNSYTGTTTLEDGSLIASNNVNASAASPFGNAASAIFVGDTVTTSTNIAMHPQLLINGPFTVARPVTVGSSGALGNAGTTFTLGGSSTNSATFSGSFLNIDQNLVVTQATGGSLTISAPISDGGNNLSLTKVGGGTVTLSGGNSYTGNTIVNQGALLIGNTSPANGVVTVADGAGAGVTATSDSTYWSPSSLTVGTGTGGTLQFSLGGTIAGPNLNTLLTPTSLTLNGTTAISITRCPQVLGSYPLFNGYNGSSPLTLASQPAGVLGQITSSSGTVYYQVTNTLTDVWTAQVDTNWDSGTANWTNNLQGNTYSLGDPVRFDDTANGISPLLVNIVSNVSPNSMTVSNTSKAYVIGGAAIAGATGLTKNGDNTLTLTGTNTFTGDLAILGGTLEIGSGGGGQLGAGTYAGNIDDETLLRYNSTSSQTLSGIISGPGAVVVTNGTLSLSGVNTYSGGTTLSNGMIIIRNGNALGTSTVTTTGGTLQWNAGNASLGNSLVVNGPTTLDDAGGNWTMNGSISGGGPITRGTAATVSLYLGGDDSGYTGTFTVPANGNAVVRITSANAGSANASWVFNQNVSSRLSLNFGNGTIYFGSMTGSGFLQQAQAGTTVVEAGDLGSNDVFSGVMQQSAGGNVLAFTKAGTGSMTLSGANTFLGGVNINGGILCVSNTSALSTAGSITFGGGTLQYSGVNGVDYSPRIANSTAAISIDLQGTNVTFATALPSSNTGGLALTNSAGIGTNKLTLKAAEAYTGSTIINGGTLALSGSGAINSSTNITVASGGTFDVSAISYTLAGSQTLTGSGVVTGAVATASSSSAILPGGANTVGTLTFQGNLNLAAGAAPVFDVSTSQSSGNDQIVVAGNLTLGSSDTIHVNALSGSSPLDQTADYVLFSVAGTTTMTTQPVLVFDNTPPSNASHYSIQQSGNNVVLHYSSAVTPVVTSVIITNTADGSTVGTRGQSATIYVTVQPGNGTLGAGSVVANLSSLGGSSSQALTSVGGNNWSYTVLLGQGAVVGTDSVGVTATDSLSASGSSAGSFTVNASSLTWNGSGGNADWGTGGNWVGTVPPGFAGDSVTFTGSANTAPNLEADYNVAGVTFDGAASSFTNGSTTGKTLTLSGPVNNNSSNPQFFTLAITNIGTPTIADSGAGITFEGPVSGSGGLEVSSGTVTLAGADTYTANTIIDGGAILKVGGSAALPYGAGAGDVNISGTLDVNGTNAAINGLSGSGTVDNTSTNLAALIIGNGNIDSTFAGVIQNTGTNLALIKTGTGTLTLSGANTYSGGLTLSNGTLVVNNNSAFGSGVVTLAGGTNQNLGNITVTNTFVAVANTTTTFDPANGNYTINGNFTGSGTITRSIGVNPPVSLFLGGDNSGFTGIFQDGNSANSVVRFTTSTAGSASARWIFNQAQLLGRTTLPAVTCTMQFGSISGAGILSAGANGVVDTIEVGALGLNDTFSGSLDDINGGAGVVALTKVGIGTLTLSGANNYTGPTIVSNGTLNVSSLKISTGDFTLIDGTTLGVNLTTNGASLQMTSLTLGNNCANTFTGTNSTTIPAITDSGALTLSGQVVMNAQGGIFAAVGQYPLISYGSITGTGGFTVGSLPAGVAANIVTNGNAIVLNVSQVPVAGPVTITNSFSGNTLTLTWPAGQGWRLVSQTNSLSTGLNPNPNAWSTVPGYTDGSYSITTDPAKPTVFYRLVNP